MKKFFSSRIFFLSENRFRIFGSGFFLNYFGREVKIK